MATLTNLPTLPTGTDTTASSGSSASATSTTGTNTATSHGSSTSAPSSAATTSAPTTGVSATSTNADTLSFSSGTAINSIPSLSNLPTIAGAGIPTIGVPFTANAPFMQKSDFPEGTVFIAIGAILAFLGACVLLWRGLVAWSVNRSVRRAALYSIRGGSEKQSSHWGGSGFNPAKGSLYKDVGGSSMSLDALTSSGKHVKPHFRDHERDSTPPAGLFFSPTAQAGSGTMTSRNSSYLPAGYYASPNAQPAGGAGTTTIGSSLAPYARHSGIAPSPPSSPGLPPTGTSRNSTAYRTTSREGLRAVSRDGYGSTRNSYFENPGRQAHSSGLYAQPSNSSLMVGTGGAYSTDNLGGSRAPSAYLDDLFSNHGNSPRERF